MSVKGSCLFIHNYQLCPLRHTGRVLIHHILTLFSYTDTALRNTGKALVSRPFSYNCACHIPSSRYIIDIPIQCSVLHGRTRTLRPHPYKRVLSAPPRNRTVLSCLKGRNPFYQRTRGAYSESWSLSPYSVESGHTLTELCTVRRHSTGRRESHPSTLIVGGGI